MNSFPIDFEALARQGGNPAAGGYPYQIKGADLMRDFVYAALDADDTLIEEVVGQGGYTQRKIKIPSLPGGVIAVNRISRCHSPRVGFPPGWGVYGQTAVPTGADVAFLFSN